MSRSKPKSNLFVRDNSYGSFPYPVTRQAAQVFALMKRDGGLTRLTAMHYGIANLTARIAELRLDCNVNVQCEVKEDAEGREYGRWFIAANDLTYVVDGAGTVVTPA